MTGRIETLSDGSTAGIISAEDGQAVPFDSVAVLAFDAASLAVGQMVTFELADGRRPKAANVCVTRSYGDERRKDGPHPRYVGFEQTGSVRAYRFELLAPGKQTRTFIVNTDLALFTRHHVGIQEGPALCLHCLLAGLNADGTLLQPLMDCSLTDKDMLDHLASRPAPKTRPGFKRAPNATAGAHSIGR
jgi:cold shock CspA family protein